MTQPFHPVEDLGTRIKNVNHPSMLTAALPLFRLKGKTYSLEDHFFFEPLFNIHLPRRALFKCARQVGKCIAKDDIGKVRKEDGSPLSTDDLTKGTPLLSMTDRYRIVPRVINDVLDNGVQPVLEVRTRLGSSFRITYNHPLLTPSGYIPAEDLVKGSRLASVRSGGVFPGEWVDRRRLISTAYMLGAGSTNKDRPEITIDRNSEYVFKDLMDAFDENEYSVYHQKNKVTWYWRSSSIREWFAEDGLNGKYAWEKDLPLWVYRLSKENTRTFLERLWATDGTMAIRGNGLSISYTSMSKSLCSGVRALLNKFGILTSTHRRKSTGCAYVTRVEGIESQRLFQECFDVPGKPEIKDYVRRNTLGGLQDIIWDTAVSVEPAGEMETFDLTMGEEHNFVLDGIISHNTQNMAAARLAKTISLAYYNSLFVCPRFEQIKRISNNYMRPLIEESPVKQIFLREGNARDQSILQRTFKNGSVHFYSFAFLDTERIRSISCSNVNLDEVQDIQWDFIPVIAETMSGSKRYRDQIYTGTPKTVDNTIQLLWQDSTQTEWVIECLACGNWNIPSIHHDLLKMIGKKGPICSKCGKPIEPRHGGWAHAFPDRQNLFVGYHIPQTIHPLHYESEANWVDLLYKMETYPEYRFMNECLGESFDAGIKLMTLADLRRLACLRPNDLEIAAQHRREYEMVAMGIDWGGGGHKSQSYTAVVIAGIKLGTDVIDVLYYDKLSRTLPPETETMWLLDLIGKFQPHFVAHDYGGAGNLRELLMIQAGVSMDKIIPYTYVASSKKPVISFDASKDTGTRSSYSIDKARSLVTLCTMMKAGKVLLPYRQERDEADAMNDFLNLTEERQERPRGSDIILVGKAAGTSDDTAHALNYACACLWYAGKGYPDLAEAMRAKLSKADLSQIAPRTPRLSDWRRPDDE